MGATALAAFYPASRVEAQMVGADPTYTLASGTASYDFFTVRATFSTEGSVTQTGGVFNVSGDFWLAPGPSGGSVDSTYTINGGTASFGRLLGSSSAVRVTQNGGTVNAGELLFSIPYFKGDYTLNAGTLNAGLISIASTSAADRESNLRLNGGTLRTSRIVAGGQRVFIRFNGATLQAETDNVNWINSGTKAYVYGGGAIFDTNGREMGLYLNLQRQPGDTVADGGLTKRGAGTLTLNFTTNSYNGPTTLEGGTLAIDKADMLGLATTNLNFRGGTLRILGTEIQDIGAHPLNSTTFNGGLDIADAAHVFTLAAPLSGSGALTKSGPGKLVLKGATTLAGPVTISAGTLQLGDGAVNGSISGQIVNNADLVYQTAGNQTYGGVILGNGTLTKSGPGALTLTNQNTYTGPTNVTGGVLILDTSSSSGTVISQGSTLTISNATVRTNGTNYNAIIFSPLILQPGGVFSAEGTSANSHTLRTITFAGGTLSGINPDARYGNYILAGSAISVTANSLINAAAVQVQNRGATPTIDTANGATLTISSPLTDTNFNGSTYMDVGSLVKNGAGTLVLSGVNKFSGATTVNAGKLSLVAPGGLYNAGTMAGPTLTLNGASILSLDRGDAFGNHAALPRFATVLNPGTRLENGGAFFNTLSNLTLNGAEVRANGGGSNVFPAFQLKGTITVGGSVASTITAPGGVNAFTAIHLGNNTSGGMTTFAVADATGSPAADLTIANELQDGRAPASPYANVPSGLIKTGAGTLTLLGANTFTGNVAVTGGTLVLGGAHGPLNGLSVASGAALTGASGTVNVTGAVTNHGTIRVTGGAVFNAGNATTFVNEGVIDLLTASAASTLPPGFINGTNGVVITRQDLAVKSLGRAGDSYSVTIAGFTGYSYQLEYSPDLTTPFVPTGAPQAGNTGTDLIFNASAPGPNGFVQVRLTP